VPAGLRGALAACIVAALFARIFRGFTVDDALVSARVASHWASGHGYRFNRSGPVVDAVTPLGWVQLLALPGPGSPLVMLERARVLGEVAWVAAAGVLGALGPSSLRGRLILLGGLALSTPLAVWATAGMETGLVALVATVALVPGAPFALAAGLAAGLRPELLPWAVVLAVGGALTAGATARARLTGFAQRLPLALGPAVFIACVRHAWFGSFAPLSSVAKAPELAHGVFYALDAALGTGVPLLLLAPRALGQSDGRTRTLTAAVAAHGLALVAAGGDWMALYRLMVPVLPAALLAAARLADLGDARWLILRAAFFAVRPLWLAVTVAWPARHVLEHRLQLVEGSRALLRGARSVACLDVGWVGAATEASILDLAGITDPVVARLPGGHTSKKVTNGLLENRDVDTVVLLLAPDATVGARWQDAPFARAVEARVAALPVLERFYLRATVPLGGTRQRYLFAAREISTQTDPAQR
jgi:hypothetical protein